MHIMHVSLSDPFAPHNAMRSAIYAQCQCQCYSVVKFLSCISHAR